MLDQIVFATFITHASFVVSPDADFQPSALGPQTSAEASWPPAGVSRPGGEVTSPRPLEEVLPRYTPDAMREKVQGSVFLQAVVEADGTVGEVRVTRSLDRRFGQDDEAIKCLKKWKFTPGRRNGVGVPVLVEVEMSFTMKR